MAEKHFFNLLVSRLLVEPLKNSLLVLTKGEPGH